jgi:hypothetical protein
MARSVHRPADILPRRALGTDAIRLELSIEKEGPDSLRSLLRRHVTYGLVYLALEKFPYSVGAETSDDLRDQGKANAPDAAKHVRRTMGIRRRFGANPPTELAPMARKRRRCHFQLRDRMGCHESSHRPSSTIDARALEIVSPRDTFF